MTTPPPLGPVRVDLFVRADSAADTVERLSDLVARARRLEDRDTVAEVEVKTWTTVRPALEALSDSASSVSTTVATFQAWADRTGYSLAPAFARRETRSLLHPGSSTELRVPVASLAVYEDGELRWVAPCADDDRSYDVEDCLAALEDGVLTPAPDRELSLQYHERDALAEPSEPPQ
ncbi:HTH domain-containing protein [Natronococcus occultus]|uniref:Uncharacterized protein n=1 Tax=Natronococcus occultus SP4 TaxID=694430 RepID=L0K0N8_9EURY|nr:HTH domain-containing protein [Natronococcus occultus]AGB38842.1 hypothetical protein Natoc_3099 [Natronococcus occultus SP4]